MITLQIIAISFSFTLIYFSVLHYRRREIEAVEAYIWAGIWTTTIFIIVFPDILRTFAKEVFITRLFDLLVVGGFMLVITMVYKSYIKVKRLERRLERFIRDEALKEIRKGKKKSRR